MPVMITRWAGCIIATTSLGGHHDSGQDMHAAPRRHGDSSLGQLRLEQQQSERHSDLGTRRCVWESVLARHQPICRA
jgi:hypothetical protein